MHVAALGSVRELVSGSLHSTAAGRCQALLELNFAVHLAGDVSVCLAQTDVSRFDVAEHHAGLADGADQPRE